MKCMIVQDNPIVGDIIGNKTKICQYFERATQENYDLIITSECFLTGYPPKDFLLYQSFINNIHIELDKIKKMTSKYPGIGLILGTPYQFEKKIYNSAVLIADGEICFVQHKRNLPNYDIFDEKRVFSYGNKSQTVRFKNKQILITICEDLWITLNDPRNPNDGYNDVVSSFNDHKYDMMINLSASPFEANKQKKRRDLFSSISKKYQVPIIFCNQYGANDELIFDGNSMVFNDKGEITHVGNSFKADTLTLHLSGEYSPLQIQDMSETEEIYEALVLGIRDYIKKCKFERVIIGLSGGIDSALTATLAVRALGAQNVLGVMMPSDYSSEGSISDSKSLAHNLKIETRLIPISNLVNCMNDTLKDEFSKYSVDITEENIQSRMRGNILMALSNKFNSLVLSTGNKSEMAVGYCTLYGDMSGALSVLADVSKTMVYNLAKYINKETEIIPHNTIAKNLLQSFALISLI